jgi:hypothetical protein
MVSQPCHKLVEAKLVCFVECREENVDLFGVSCETRSVDGEKSICGSESCALVAVNDGMALRKTLPERGGFLNQVGAITRLGAA